MYNFKVMPNGEIGYIKRFDKGYALYITCRATTVQKIRETSIMDICIKRKGELLIDKPIHKNLRFRDIGIHYTKKEVEEVIMKMQEFINE